MWSMERTLLMADDRFSSHQAGLMLHMGLRSFNVTYPNKFRTELKIERLANSLVAYLH